VALDPVRDTVRVRLGVAEQEGEGDGLGEIDGLRGAPCACAEYVWLLDRVKEDDPVGEGVLVDEGEPAGEGEPVGEDVLRDEGEPVTEGVDSLRGCHRHRLRWYNKVDQTYDAIGSIRYNGCCRVHGDAV